MARVLLLVELVTYFSLAHTITILPGVEISCPSMYHVQTPDGRSITMEMREKPDCIKTLRRYSKKAVENKMKPYVTVSYTLEQYRANISWEFTPRGRQLPKRLLLYLSFYDIEDSNAPQYLDSTCIQLFVRNRDVQNKAVIQFYFDCLPLLNEPNIGIVAQWWSYSRGPSRLCRTKRSLTDDDGPCSPGIQCSQEYSFPISKNAHTYRQCACYIKHHGNPKLDWKYDSVSNTFRINLTNLPPYLDSAEVEIVDAENETQFDSKYISGQEIQDGSVSLNSLVFYHGDFSVYVCVTLKLALVCKYPDTERLYKDEINVECNYDGNSIYLLFADQTIEVPPTTVMPTAFTYRPPADVLKPEYILGIVGIILVAGFIIITTFIWCRCRNRTTCCASLESLTNTYLQKNNTRGATDADLYELSPEQTPFTRGMLDVDCELDKPDVDSELDKPGVDSELDKPGVDSELGNIERETSLQDSKHNVMLLYHPARANPSHIQKVAELCQTLDKHGIKLERRKTGNWRDFAESAFDKFPEVVLVMSEGLYTMCHNGKYGTPVPQDILADRNQETIPCVVLNKMCTLVHDHPDNTDLALHIVSLDNQDGQDEMLIKNFLQDHDFLRRNENCHVYYFGGNNLDSDENQDILNQFVTRLKPNIS